MRFRTISATVGRIIVSGMIAFFVLSLFYSFYYNVPDHFECEGGATDYKWQPNTFYCRATEGFAWGRTNGEGYNNNPESVNLITNCFPNTTYFRCLLLVL